MRKTILFFSLLLSLLAGWTILELFFSSQSWWYWNYDSGMKWVLFLYIGLPLLFLSILFRISVKVRINYYYDLFFWGFYFLYGFIVVFQGNKYKFLSSDELFLTISVINLIIPLVLIIKFFIDKDIKFNEIQ